MNAASVQCFLKKIYLSVMRLFHTAAVLVARYKCMRAFVLLLSGASPSVGAAAL